jgi:hypothetical protein
MAKRRLLLLILPILALIAALGPLGCGEEQTEIVVQPEPGGTVTFHLDHFVGTEALQLDTLAYANARGTVYSISRLQYVISDVVMHGAGGQVYGMDGIHFRDHTDPATRSFRIAGVPGGTYDRVSFTFGLDASKNVKNAFLGSDPVFHLAMEWPGPLGGDQGLGYHYMKLEGNFEDAPGGSTTGYTTHTGARWCAVPCGPMSETDVTAQHHFFRVHLPIAATKVGNDAWEVMLDFDVNAWYTDATPGDAYDTEYDWHDLPTQMIMANTGAQRMLQANGPGCFTASVLVAP